jgi:glutaredoxin 3
MRRQNMAKIVKIYSTPTCPYCKMAKQFLNDNRIEFTDLNVAEDQQAAKEMVSRSGQMGVPVIDIEGQLIIGFDKGAIKKALNLS